jgi:hypothetical protein
MKLREIKVGQLVDDELFNELEQACHDGWDSMPGDDTNAFLIGKTLIITAWSFSNEYSDERWPYIVVYKSTISRVDEDRRTLINYQIGAEVEELTSRLLRIAEVKGESPDRDFYPEFGDILSRAIGFANAKRWL